MKTLITAWFIFLFVSFLVSFLALSVVQIRLIRKEGFAVFHQRSLLQLYWRELGLRQRAMVWPGIVAFFTTLLAAAVYLLLKNP